MMKNPLFFLLMMVLFVGACKDDDDNNGSEPIFTSVENIINLDGENFSAPNMPAGQYEMAALFSGSFLQQYQGKFLKDVAVYLTNVPAATEFIIYGQGQNGQQGDVLYQANVSASVSTDSWNSHRLSTPIEITGEDLWIAVFVDHPSTFGSVGCDAGPVNGFGDQIYEYGTTSWVTFRNFTSGESNINWNIRGNIGD